MPSIKWTGMAILTQHVMNACQGGVVLATEGLRKRWSASFIKVSGRMCSDTFKRRPVFSFTAIISALYYVPLKSFVTKALECI